MVTGGVVARETHDREEGYTPPLQRVNGEADHRGVTSFFIAFFKLWPRLLRRLTVIRRLLACGRRFSQVLRRPGVRV